MHHKSGDLADFSLGHWSQAVPGEYLGYLFHGVIIIWETEKGTIVEQSPNPVDQVGHISVSDFHHHCPIVANHSGELFNGAGYIGKVNQDMNAAQPVVSAFPEGHSLNVAQGKLHTVINFSLACLGGGQL
jgi:hypothetical protein